MIKQALSLNSITEPWLSDGVSRMTFSRICAGGLHLLDRSRLDCLKLQPEPLSSTCREGVREPRKVPEPSGAMVQPRRCGASLCRV